MTEILKFTFRSLTRILHRPSRARRVSKKSRFVRILTRNQVGIQPLGNLHGVAQIAVHAITGFGEFLERFDVDIARAGADRIIQDRVDQFDRWRMVTGDLGRNIEHLALARRKAVVNDLDLGLFRNIFHQVIESVVDEIIPFNVVLDLALAFSLNRSGLLPGILFCGENSA